MASIEVSGQTPQQKKEYSFRTAARGVALLAIGISFVVRNAAVLVGGAGYLALDKFFHKKSK
ncbi:hypothetical protein HGB07_04480 [Candidatus Roizmanbacteria bacterium]|nr:hypothetical protein [Candidatus Roizmanbacteria bacterium]